MEPRTTLTTANLKTTTEYLEALAGLGIRTVEDLLLYLPRTHEDLSTMQTVGSAPLDTKVTISGTVEDIRLIRTKRGKKLVTATFTDREGESIEVLWFNQPHIKRMLADGDDVVLTGKIVENGYKLQFQSPIFEKEGKRPLVHAGRLVAIYPQHEKITSKWLREKIVLVEKMIDRIDENLPEDIVKEEELLPRPAALRAMHFPDDPEQVLKAQERFAFERMFLLQKNVLTEKQEWQGERSDKLKIPMDVELIRTFFQSLKFTPTDSQRIAIYEILRDMEKDQPMSRLLEGDVGSGKTLVATAVIAHVLKHGGQSALMVPTEVLAKQHAQNITRLLIHFHSFIEAKRKAGEINWSVRLPTVALLTGSLPPKEALAIKQSLQNGTIDLVIGTHALITETVQFKNLLFVIVDEQHRFGVSQRMQLKEKGTPHFLAMTATPIPRTLALTAYGHHDLSVLLEKPGNRQKIETKVVPPKDRLVVERFIDVQIDQGRQIFVICPLIRESEHEDMNEIKNVQQETERLKESFSRRRIAALHGQMSAQEKDDIMRRFKEKEFDILVSTAVIEVGIDVPNATIIVIEGAERFGLAQLHQFRGRVGRSDEKSYCYLFTTTPEQARSVRLKAMEKHDSGFVLAEIDLKIRGPGELFGLRQSGIPEVSLTSLLNPELIVRARRAAERSLGMSAKTA